MIEDRHIALAYGNGGRLTRTLIEELFALHLANDELDVGLDAAPLDLPAGMVPMITTDGFTVQPLEFPGGDIGSLAVNGTVNDLAVSGATPLYLTLNAFIEEGFEVETLERLVQSIAVAAKLAGVKIVAGDTKVLPRGQGGGLYLATTGVGTRPADLELGLSRVEVGDRVLVSGPVGDHGIAVMLAREAFDLKGPVQSDCAPVHRLTEAISGISGLKFMRDPTRGGLATVAHEIAMAASTTVRLKETDVPVQDPVRSVCDMLGYDPYYLACEGRVVAIVAPEVADEALAIWQQTPGGEGAAIIGTIEEGRAQVLLETEIGGSRVLDELEDDPLPRIC